MNELGQTVAAASDGALAGNRPGRPWRITLRCLTIWFLVVGTVGGASAASRREEIAKLVVHIQRADYEGDRAALKRFYKGLAPFIDDKQFGAKVRYWRGFSMWRRALNGFNDSVDRAELEQDIRHAISEFEAAAAKEPAFVDAKVATASCVLTLVFLYQKDAVQVRQFLAKALPLLKEAEMAEPENPRLLWVLGAGRWYVPLERGGGQAKALETYQKGLEAARKQKCDPRDMLIPSWGEPELLMNLAWSNLNRSAPDLAAAEQYAQSALALVPYWHYVKDILIPQIAAAKGKQSQGGARDHAPSISPKQNQ
jgi:hypothetical protein